MKQNLNGPEEISVHCWKHEQSTSTAPHSEGREYKGRIGGLEVHCAQQGAVDQEDEREVEHLDQLGLFRGTRL